MYFYQRQGRITVVVDIDIISNLPPYPTVKSHCSASHTRQPASTASRQLPPLLKLCTADKKKRNKHIAHIGSDFDEKEG